MAIFEIQGPDGKAYEVEANSMEEAAQGLAPPWGYVGTPGNYRPDVKGGGRLAAAARTGLQGMTFGTGDEIVARGTSLLSGRPYEEELARERERLRQNREDYPAMSTVGEFGGAVATAVTPIGLGGQVATRVPRAAQALGRIAPRAAQALGRIAPRAAQAVGQVAGKAPLASRMVAGAGEGAALSGLYGFNASEGDFSERLKDARTASYWGAGGGALTSLAGGVAQKGQRAWAGRKAKSQMLKETPSTEDLLKRGKGAMDAAERGAKTASPEQTADYSARLRSVLLDKGYIAPDDTLVPGVGEGVSRAHNLSKRYERQSMTPRQMQTFREVLGDAAGSQAPQEARIGKILRDQFDEWADPLRPGHAEGRALYAAGKRGEKMDQLATQAANQAGQFKGSGYENALRTQYRQLAQRIAKGQARGYTPEQVEAIQRVARGGPIENAARNVGSLAPNRPFHAIMGGGMPATLAMLAGLSPQAAFAIGGGLLTASAVGRTTATTMQKRNAQIAAALMRGGKVAEMTPAQLAEQARRAKLIERMLLPQVAVASGG
jgi:hypothetical protein